MGRWRLRGARERRRRARHAIDQDGATCLVELYPIARDRRHALDEPIACAHAQAALGHNLGQFLRRPEEDQIAALQRQVQQR